MKNRLVSITLALGLIAAFSVVSLGEGQVFDASVKSQGQTNVDISASSEYTATTSIENSSFDAGDFSIDMLMSNIGWMNVSDTREGSMHFKTGASTFDLNQEIPNLARFAVAERMAQGSLVGYTFDCHQLGTWTDGTGSWTVDYDVDYNTPKTKIREALNELKNTLVSMRPEIIDDMALGYEWCDNYITLPAGTEFQLGNTVFKITQNCKLDDVVDLTESADPPRIDNYESDFAKFIDKVYGCSEISTVEENKNYIYLPKSFILSMCNTKLKSNKAILISFESSSAAQTDALGQLYDALSSANKQNSVYTCDADAVFESGFNVINEMLGIMIPGDSKVTVSVICEHNETYVDGKTDPTIFDEGYTGDVRCSSCNEVLTEGKVIPRLEVRTANLKTGKSTTYKVKNENEDSIVSLSSSNTGIVTAVKSGETGVKLTAKKKVGTATVKITLASGMTGKITVKVTSTPCSKITIKSGTSVTVKKRKTHQIKAVRSPSSCVQKITYKSANKKIATVTSTGKVKGIKKGKTKITVKCGTKTRTIKITVK